MQISNTLSKKLSIIIVNYKSKDLLEGCITSIYKNINSNVPFDIIVVNNDASENVSFILEKYPKIKIVNQNKNVGFGAGNNIGAKEAQGEFMLFLNPDTEIISETFEKVLKKFDENEDIKVLGSGLITSSGKIQKWSTGLEINLKDLILNNFGFFKSKKIWENENSDFVDWVSGAAMFVRKSDFLKLGGFDDDYFMYFEDMDFCKRIREKGGKILYFPEFQVKHKNGKSYDSKKVQKRNYYDSQEKYFKKHHGILPYYFIKVLRRAKIF